MSLEYVAPLPNHYVVIVGVRFFKSTVVLVQLLHILLPSAMHCVHGSLPIDQGEGGEQKEVVKQLSHSSFREICIVIVRLDGAIDVFIHYFICAMRL